jgi:1,4-dihydroxy-2-naphthoate octaprenyltransferase
LKHTHSSRKFLLCLFSLILISIITVLGVFYPAIQTTLPAFIGGVIGILSVYYTGNVATKFVIDKQVLEVEASKKKEEGGE